MAESLEWLGNLIALYPSLTYLIIFLGAAFGGEPGVLALSFLAAQDLFPLWLYLVIAFAGVLASDSLYFFLGKTKLARRLIEHRYAAGTIAVIMEAVDRLSRGKHTLAFILAKFIIGTRAVIIMYVSKTGLSYRYFLRHNLLAIIVWLGLVHITGYLAGLGFAYVSQILENVYAGLGFVLLFLIVVFIIQSRLKKAFVKEEEKILEGEKL